MYNQLDVSSRFGDFDLGKVANLVLIKSFSLLEKIFGNIGGESPNRVANSVLENSFKQLIPKEMPYELTDYQSRNTLRSIVGLSPIEINTVDKDAIRKLKGSISWLSGEKIDVTDIIREMREC